VAYDALSGFEATTFDDAANGFSDGQAGFGNGCQTASTSWTGVTDILLRRYVSVPPGVSDVSVHVAIDNDVRVFWNGTDVSGGLVSSENCAVYDEYAFVVADNLLTPGDNLLRCAAEMKIPEVLSSWICGSVRRAPTASCPSRRMRPAAVRTANDPSRLEAEPVNTARLAGQVLHVSVSVAAWAEPPHRRFTI
jgi:hypothetical protein